MSEPSLGKMRRTRPSALRAAARICAALLVSVSTVTGLPQDLVATTSTTSTAAASTTTTGRPLVDSAALQSLVKLPALLAHAQALQDIAYATEGRNRYSGTAGHNATIDYIVSTLKATPGSGGGPAYDIELQPFSARVVSGSNASLTVSGPDDGDIFSTDTARILSSSPEGTAVGELVLVANQGCYIEDYPTPPAVRRGAFITLIPRGNCSFSDKSALSGRAGALAAIVYNNVDDDAISFTLTRVPNPLGPKVLTVGISRAAGMELVERLQRRTTEGGGIPAPPLIANVTAHFIMQTIYSQNVIATTVGDGGEGNDDTSDILILGAHSDSVEEGPGINDNASGTATLLELAVQLAKFRTGPGIKVRFAWWTAEEDGLLGSTWYVNRTSPAELARIRLYLNFDMLASPNYKLGIYDSDGAAFGNAGPPGSAEAMYLFRDWFVDQGLNWTAMEFGGRSDYQAFISAGIPASGLDTGAEKFKTPKEVEMFGGQAGVPFDPNYHGPGDTMDNLSHDAFLINSRAVAHAIGTYGRSFDGFPERTLTPETDPKRALLTKESLSLYKLGRFEI